MKEDILITVCSRETVMMLRCHYPHIIISIVDNPPWGSGKPIAFESFDIGDSLLAVLTLSFGDFHEQHFGFKHEGRSLEEYAMQPEHGVQIRDFLARWKDQYRVIIVHCEAGVSRSPSIAVAIAEHLGISKHSIEPVTRNWNFQPLNPHCYRLTKEALETKGELTGRTAPRLGPNGWE